MICHVLYHRLRVDFERSGIESPDLDSRLLIQHIMNWSHTNYVMAKQDTLPQTQIAQIEALARRRMGGEPIDHILGYRDFYGRRFEISKDVLSPRPETEGLVNKALRFVQNNTTPRVLDLGTGCGAIIITILAERTDAMGTSVDLSEAALNIASQNAILHDVNERLTLLQGDWFEPVSGYYDLIVSNPPYITDAAMDGLSKEVSGFDPDLALRGGADGLVAYKVILENALDYLKLGGGLIFEIGYDQGTAVSNLMLQAGFEDIEVAKDLAGHERIVMGLYRDN